MKLINHTMKTWDRAAKAQLRGEMMISKQQFDFILRKSAVCASLLKVLMEKYREVVALCL